MTIEEELALIRQNRSEPAPAADPGAGPAQPDPYADLTPPETGLAPLPATGAGFGEVFGAAFEADGITRDVRNLEASMRRSLVTEMERLLPMDVRQRIADPMMRPGSEWSSLPELVTAEAARIAASSPEAAAQWAGYPLSIEAFDQQINTARKRQLDEAQAVLDQPGGAVAEVAGNITSSIADPINLFLMPLGVSGGFLRTVASEAVLGGLGAAASLPAEYRVAEDLDLQDPNPVASIGLGAAGGALFSGVLYGAAKGLQHGANWWRARRDGLSAAMPAGGDALRFEAEVDAAEGALRGDQTVQEALRLPGSEGPAPGTLGAVLTEGTGLRLPGAEALPYNEGATIRAIVGVESGGNPNAANPASSAVGAGQFIASTWLGMMRRYKPDLVAGMTDNQILGLRTDANLSVEMTAMYARENAQAMQAAGIQGIGPGEIYLGHFMGPGGAIRALQSPLDTPISALMSPKEIKANRGIRFNGKSFVDFTAGDLRAWAQHKMRSAYDPNAISDLPSFSGPTSRGFTGTGQVRAGDEFTIDVQYEVVDLASLTRASGDLQPRDRSRIASDAWIADTAARLDPAQLMPSPTADRGAPIVGPDNIIESGNGRFGAIARVYERHPDRAAAYRAQIEAAGYAVPEGVQQPVLIARRTSDLSPDQRVSFAVAAQDSGVAVMTPTEMARASSRAMTGPVLGQLDPAKPLTDAANGGFVRGVLAALPRSARNAMFDASGLLNASGQRQLREALFARAWPDPDILARFTEGDAGDLKSLLEALERAAPSFAALKADIEAGLVQSEMDISGYVLDAMRLIGAARDLAASSKMPVAKAVAELLDEVDLIDGAIAPLTSALVRKFWKGGKAAAADDVASFLTRYADDARKAGASGGMFDAPGPRDVLIAIDRDTFGDLPENLGNVRGFARPGQTDADSAARAAADPGQGFDAGAGAPDAVAADAEIRAALEAPVDPMPVAAAPATPAPDLRAQAAAEVDALRGQFDDFEIDMPDGTTVTVREVLDDLDADAQFDAFIQSCAITPTGAAQ